jgi:hypothetical protein
MADMPITVGVETTRPGQGSTTWLIAAAWDAAETQRVLIVDADPAGGTVEEQLGTGLGVGADQLGMARLIGPSVVTAEMLELSAVQHPRRPNLWLIPGLRGDSAQPVTTFLNRLIDPGSGVGRQPGQAPRPSIEAVKFDLVMFDLGCPHSFPGLLAPPAVSEALVHTFQRLFVVVKADPSLSNHNAEVLRKSRMPRGEVVVTCYPQGAQDSRATYRQILADNSPNLKLATADWLWKQDTYLASASDGRGMPAVGMAKSLGLLVSSSDVLETADVGPAVVTPPKRKRTKAGQ